jgi:hypothetical protein
MLGSLMNGATLYIRTSDWNATLEKVRTLWLCFDIKEHHTDLHCRLIP